MTVHLKGLLVLHRILLRQEFVIPFPGPAEMPLGLTLLALLTVFAPRTLLAIGGLPVGWFDAAALLLALTGLAQIAFDTLALARSLEGPQPPRH